MWINIYGNGGRQPENGKFCFQAAIGHIYYPVDADSPQYMMLLSAQTALSHEENRIKIR